MTLPSSGPLSLSAIQGEFGGANPISLSEYYAGGGLVPAGTTSPVAGPVPSSGTISIYNFYGTSNFVPHTDTYYSGSGNAVVPGGAVQVVISVQGGSAAGGYGDYDSFEDQNYGGGGGGSGGWVQLTRSLNGSDAGVNISYTVGIDGIIPSQLDGTSSTVSGSVSGGSIGITAGGGQAGNTGTPGSGGSGGTATGGNTNNAGNPGGSGSSGSGGGGGGPPSGGTGQGGDGGYGPGEAGSDGSGVYISFAWT